MSNQNQQKQFTGQELRDSEERFSIIFDKSPLPTSLFKFDDLRYTDVNTAWCDFYGFSREEAIGRTSVELKILDSETLERLWKIYLCGGVIKNVEVEVYTKHGEKKHALTSIETITFRKEKFAINMVVDITEQKKAVRNIAEHDNLEKQFIQAQKMEAVGRLAGGVAHDINNMLSLIQGYAELAMEKTSSYDPMREDLEMILDAGKRSAEITRQLLGFARKQNIAPKVLDLNEVVANALKMFRRLIGEDINLGWLPGEALWTVKIDPSQVDQILANLCVNARDAIDGVGKITIETSNVILDDAYCPAHEGSVPGEFVMLAVSDSGCGMEKEILDHCFEPFFTTKDVSKGTGLGLSTVYGIIKQNDGYIYAYSEPDRGTTFKIYLPYHAGEPEKVKAKTIPEKLVTGHGETLLLVEDELPLLELAKMMLARLNYNILTASNPYEAITLVQKYGKKIHLLITDIIMPEMNGHDLAERIRGIHPDIKCLFMSGYAESAVVHHQVLEGEIHFISKPFSYPELAAKVREALDEICN
ncbi:MAG: response regulator [Desulfobulbaceae bacterium]|nr:response regulator [Desulfobulbaceae bacterium]